MQYFVIYSNFSIKISIKCNSTSRTDGMAIKIKIISGAIVHAIEAKVLSYSITLLIPSFISIF